MSTRKAKRKQERVTRRRQQGNSANVAPGTVPLSVRANRFLEEHPARSFLLLSSFLVFLLYWRSFTSPFVYDDLDGIVNNPNLSSWSDFTHRFLLRPVALTTSLLSHTGSTYRPLFWLTLFLDRAIWGLNAGGFHATNVALHLFNGNLAFLLLRRLRQPLLPAAATALLWLALPINTEVVAWVSGRAYALCTLFVLACLLSALNYFRGGKAGWAAACFIAAACAVLSHELGVVLIPLLLLLPLAAQEIWSKKVFITLAAACLAIAGVEALRFKVGVKTFSGLASAKGASLALIHYVALTLLPIHMSVERSTSIVLNQPHPWLILESAGFFLTFTFAVIVRRRLPALFLGLVWFIICIAPFCLAQNYQGIAERFVYLAALGLVTTLVVLPSLTSTTRFRAPLLALLALWFLWNLYRTSERANDWSDPVRLYQASLRATPQSPSVHYNLAFSLRERGGLDEALEEYGRVLALDPHYPNAYASLGDVYLKLNNFIAAQAAYRQALFQAPNDTAVLLNSGVAYQNAGALPEAETTYKHILQIDPANSPAHVNLGVLFLAESKNNDAAHQFAMAIDLKSKDPVPYYNLGALLQKGGRGDLAMVLYKKVLELKPGDEDTLRNMQLIQQSR